MDSLELLYNMHAKTMSYAKQMNNRHTHTCAHARATLRPLLLHHMSTIWIKSLTLLKYATIIIIIIIIMKLQQANKSTKVDRSNDRFIDQILER